MEFNEARHGLLEALAQEPGWSLLKVVRAYNHDEDFRREIDLAAVTMSFPTSEAIH